MMDVSHQAAVLMWHGRLLVSIFTSTLAVLTLEIYCRWDSVRLLEVMHPTRLEQCGTIIARQMMLLHAPSAFCHWNQAFVCGQTN
jgi:hypothetical protein